MTSISIIMPLYNAQKYLQESLECIRNQTFSDYELICVNDASTDDTMKILKQYQECDSRIRIYENEMRMGAAYSRNYGIKNAAGTYVIFLDGDDIFDEQILELSWKAAEKNHTDIVMFDYIHQKSEDIHIKKSIAHSSQYIEKYCITPFSIIDQKPYDWARWSGGPCNKLFRTEFIRRNNIRFQNLSSSNDVYFIFLALLLSQRTLVLNEELVMVYARDHNTVTRISFNRDPMCAFEAIKYLQEVLVERKLFENYYQHFYYWAFFMLRTTLERIKDYKIKEKFYLFLQQEGIKTLICNGGSCFNDLESDIKGWFENFLKEDLQSRWYETKTYLFFCLRDRKKIVESIFKKYSDLQMKIAVWGAGRNGNSLLEFCDRNNLHVHAVIDTDKNKQGKNLFGVPIRAYEDICDDIQVIIISAQNIYTDVKEITKGSSIEIIDINILMDYD